MKTDTVFRAGRILRRCSDGERYRLLSASGSQWKLLRLSDGKEFSPVDARYVRANFGPARTTRRAA